MASNNTRKQDAPSASLSGAWSPASIDAENLSVEVTFTAGASVDRVDPWSGERFLERLVVSDDAVDLGRLRKGAPVLDSHRQDGVRSQLGVVQSAWVSGGKGHARIRFAEAHRDVFDMVREGVLRSVSIGYRVHQQREIEPENGGLPIREATRWEPHEISMISVPADADAQTRAQPSYQASAAVGEVREGETEVTETNGATTPENNVTMLATERKRALWIGEHVEKYGLGAEFKRDLIENTTTLAQARARLTDALAERDMETHTQNQIEPGDGRREASFADEAAEGLLVRERVLKSSDNPAANEIAGWSFVELAQRVLRMHGASERPGNKIDLLQRAFNTSSTLVNTVATFSTRSMMQAYEAPPRTFLDAFRESSSRNFRNNERIRLSDAPALAVVAEGADFQEVSLTDRKETYAVSKFGHILKFTFEAMVNDDLDALTRQAERAGFSAATAESDTFWGIVTGNGNLSDAAAIFSGDSISNGVALSADALEDIRETFRTATSETGVSLNLTPRYLFVAPDLERTAEKLLRPPVNHSTGTLTDVLSNAYASQLELRVESRLPAGDYLVVADYRQIDQMEFAWLDGMRGPQIAQDPDFDSAGLKYRVLDIFGAGAVDRRGMLYNDQA